MPAARKPRSGLTKHQRKIVAGVVERWAATINGDTTPDVEIAKQCVRMAYPKSRRDKLNVVIVRSPAMFYLLQGVCRGILSKAMAVKLAQRYGLKDLHLIDDVRRSALYQKARHDRRYRWLRQTNPLLSSWKAIAGETVFEEKCKRAEIFNIELGVPAPHDPNASPWFDEDKPRYILGEEEGAPEARRSRRDDDALMSMQHNGINDARNYFHLDSTPRDSEHGRALRSIYYTASADRAMCSRMEALENTLNESRVYSRSAREPDCVDREVLCKILGVTDPEITWEHEIFHHATGYMLFQKHALVLMGEPTLRFNEAGELHNDAGPAIEWADGSTMWYDNGHNLGGAGEKIVMRPDDLTVEDFNNENNQEIRRIILDILGWDKYLSGAGAFVLDKRENDVDNTIELLVAVPRTPDLAPLNRAEALKIPDRRVVLACRSTGRKYCLNVAEEIETCEEAQAWMAGGMLLDADAQREFNLPCVPMRVIGAS